MKTFNTMSQNTKRILITLFVLPALIWSITAYAKGHKYGIDKDTCIGCGNCWGNYPESFEEDYDGKARGTEYSNEGSVSEAQRECPTESIWTNF